MKEKCRKFSIDNLTDNDYFVSLLFYMGLLTINRPYFSQEFLGIPNYSIKTLYWEYISRLTQETSGLTIETRLLNGASDSDGRRPSSLHSA